MPKAVPARDAVERRQANTAARRSQRHRSGPHAEGGAGETQSSGAKQTQPPRRSSTAGERHGEPKPGEA